MNVQYYIGLLSSVYLGAKIIGQLRGAGTVNTGGGAGCWGHGREDVRPKKRGFRMRVQNQRSGRSGATNLCYSIIA